MGLSVTEPIERAIDRTKFILFQPFQIEKWFTLGFCAFLANLGSGAGNFNSFNRFGGSHQAGDSLKSAMEPVQEWVLAHLALVCVGVFLVLLLGLVLAWLQARGQFMLLDGVVHNRGEVAAPWREYKSEGNSLFGFNLAFGMATLLGVALIGGLGIALALPDIRAEEFGRPAITALLVGIPLLLVFLLTASIITVFLHDFVIPTMYLRRQRVMEAWGTARREVFAGRASTLVLYILMKIVLALAIGLMAVLAVCLTCCCAAIPYIGTVIMLPLFVFGRSYSLYFLEQLGEGWSFFERQAEKEAEIPGEIG